MAEPLLYSSPSDILLNDRHLNLSSRRPDLYDDYHTTISPDVLRLIHDPHVQAQFFQQTGNKRLKESIRLEVKVDEDGTLSLRELSSRNWIEIVLDDMELEEPKRKIIEKTRAIYDQMYPPLPEDSSTTDSPTPLTPDRVSDLREPFPKLEDLQNEIAALKAMLIAHSTTSPNQNRAIRELQSQIEILCKKLETHPITAPLGVDIEEMIHRILEQSDQRQQEAITTLIEQFDHERAISTTTRRADLELQNRLLDELNKIRDQTQIAHLRELEGIHQHYQAQLTMLNTNMQEVREEARTDQTSLRAEHEATVAEIREEHQATMAILQEHLEATKGALQSLETQRGDQWTRLTDELNAIRIELTRTQHLYQDQLDRVNQEHRDELATFNTRMQTMHQEHQEEIQAERATLRDEHDHTLREIRQDHGQAITTLTEQLNTTRRSFEDMVQHFAQTLEKAQLAVQSKQDHRLTRELHNLQTELSNTQEAHARELAKIQEQYQQTTAELRAQAQLATHNTALAEMQKTFARTEQLLTHLIEQTQEELGKTREQLTAAIGDTREAQGELEAQKDLILTLKKARDGATTRADTTESANRDLYERFLRLDEELMGVTRALREEQDAHHTLQARFDKTQADHQQLQEELEKTVGKIETLTKEHTEAFARLTHSFEQALRDKENAAYQAECAREEQYTHKLAHALEEFKTLIHHSDQSHQREIAEIRQSHSETIEHLKEIYTKQIDGIKREHEEEMRRKDVTSTQITTTLTEALDAAKLQHQALLEKTLAEHTRHIEILSNQHSSDTQYLLAHFKQTLQTLRQDHTQTLDVMKQDRANLQDEFENMTTTLQNRLTQAEQIKDETLRQLEELQNETLCGRDALTKERAAREEVEEHLTATEQQLAASKENLAQFTLERNLKLEDLKRQFEEIKEDAEQSTRLRQQLDSAYALIANLEDQLEKAKRVTESTSPVFNAPAHPKRSTEMVTTATQTAQVTFDPNVTFYPPIPSTEDLQKKLEALCAQLKTIGVSGKEAEETKEETSSLHVGLNEDQTQALQNLAHALEGVPLVVESEKLKSFLLDNQKYFGADLESESSISGFSVPNDIKKGTVRVITLSDEYAQKETFYALKSALYAESSALNFTEIIQTLLLNTEALRNDIIKLKEEVKTGNSNAQANLEEAITQFFTQFLSIIALPSTPDLPSHQNHPTGGRYPTQTTQIQALSGNGIQRLARSSTTQTEGSRDHEKRKSLTSVTYTQGMIPTTGRTPVLFAKNLRRLYYILTHLNEKYYAKEDAKKAPEERRIQPQKALKAMSESDKKDPCSELEDYRSSFATLIAALTPLFTNIGEVKVRNPRLERRAAAEN
jgi:hypothetical protein